MCISLCFLANDNSRTTLTEPAAKPDWFQQLVQIISKCNEYIVPPKPLNGNISGTRFVTIMSLDAGLQSKEAFYAELDALDRSLRDDSEDYGEDLEFRMRSRAFFANSQRAAKKTSQAKETSRTLTHELSTPISLVRSATLPAMRADPASTIIKATPFTATAARSNEKDSRDQHPSSTPFVEDTPLQNPNSSIFARLNRSTTTPSSLLSMTKNLIEQSPSVMSSTNNRTRAARGRGRGRPRVRDASKTKDAVPQNEQILKGLKFYYVRGERKGLRKKQMERAEAFGAVVTQELLECTHVIVDKDLTYEHIKEFIPSVLGKESPVVVREEWPLACCDESEKRVLPVSVKYWVSGMPALQSIVGLGKQAEAPTTTQASEVSPKVKAPCNNPNKGGPIPSCTPSQSDASPVQRLDKRKAEDISVDLVSSQDADIIGSLVPESQVQVERKTREHRPTNLGGGDELSQFISRVREDFNDLPRLEEDDDGFDPAEGDERDDGTDEEPTNVNKRRRSIRKRTSPKTEKKKELAEYFACNRGGTKDQSSNPNNPNARTIAVFKQMLAYYEQTNDQWRLRAYRNAINTLSRTPILVTTADEAELLPCFGKRLAQKLEEIVNTNTLQRLKHAQNDPKTKTLALFLGIHGVGKTTADKWIAQGFKTLEDLVQKADLNANQKIGIEHHKDLNSRIPRDEVTKIVEFVRAAAAKIDGEVELLVGGSYRRGADTSGDVDFIITKPGTTSRDDLVPFLAKLVGHLTSVGFLTAKLASHDFGRDDGGSKWQGCCVLPPDDSSSSPSPRAVWRRIDILLVPETEYGAALIYFTGNDIFNRSLRLLASRKGMRLNQRGLYKDVLRGPYGRPKITTGELIEGRDEKRIFEILGVKWREPAERWC